ncbi:PVC-type heme-binding CxxCH protein [Luteolibacter sp. AS25]|uniref:PVC-type heme-binding CxxCH protein n=1 Tax=Luteolibacter sp. AS25 TaxID=3135776 RepID=UPI00398A6F03
MKKIIRPLLILLTGLTPLLAEPITLFDGKTLEGWEYNPKVWRVEDGAITGGSTTENIKTNYFISTKQSFQNFELKLKIKCSGDPETGLINSGIQIRSIRLPKGEGMAGYQIDCGDNWFGKIYDEHRRRQPIALPVDEAALKEAVDTFGWNEYRIRAEGTRIQVWINDVFATDYTEVNPNIALDGVIAPQVHGGGVALVQIKDITIEELPPTENAPTWESLGGLDAALKKAPPERKNKAPKKARKKAPAQGKNATPAAEDSPPIASKKTQSGRTSASSPSEELAGFTVPEGFVIELVASEENGVINPIDISFDDAGRLWTQTAEMYPMDPITDISFSQVLKLMDDTEAQEKNPNFKKVRDLYQLKSKGTDKILVLDDPTKPATGQIHAWAEGLSIPQSILPYKDGAYVAHGSELFLLRDTDGDNKSDTMEPVLTGFGFTDTHTMAHLLVRSPGNYIHFSQGALNKGLVTAVASGKQTRIDAASQVRFSLDGKDLEIVSVGLANMWGLQIRSNGQWYGTEANDLGYSVIPYEHGTGMKGPASKPIRSYQPYLPVVHDFRVGGTGISGLAFAEDLAGGFPAEWKDIALLANPITNTINAVRIVRNTDGSVTAEHLPDFLTAEDDWFRPVNLEFGPDGCLYIADFYNKIVSHNEVTTSHPDRDKSHGRIWRIRHVDQPERKIPDVTKATPEQLIAHLKAPILWEKRAAWHQIVDRNLSQLTPELSAIASAEEIDIPTRILALWSLEDLGQFDEELMKNLVSAADENLRREAIRSLATFSITPARVASLVGPAINDSNAMIRSQAIRTLGDLNESDPAVINLLIEASKPALSGLQLGGSYERTFERFLARMALEKFPAQLKAYLASSSDKHDPTNVLWAIQALDDEASKKDIFLQLWSKVSGSTIDSETFVAIAGALNNKEIYAAVAPTFQKENTAIDYAKIAVANQSRVQSKQLAAILTPAVKYLLQSEETLPLALNAISSLKITGLNADVSKIEVEGKDPATLRLLVSAMAINAKQNSKPLSSIASDRSLPADLRIDAAHSIAQVDPKAGKAIFVTLMEGRDPTALATVFSQSKAGAKILTELYAENKLTDDAFDRSSAERISQAFRKNTAALAIKASSDRKIEEQQKTAAARIEHLVDFIGKNPGNPEAGKAIFSSCLACHAVGSEGAGIAPPLDGSGLRDLEHLLTAIVSPDDAVEGAYGLYRITKTDGSSIEGFLEKEEPLGKTVAVMGGGRIFVPTAEIKRADFVAGRSFMPASFGGLPDATMADLISYISTLK